MPKIAGNEIRPGSMIEHQGQLWIAVKTQAVKPGKGGAYAQVELKDIVNGTKLNERFRASEVVEEIHLDKKDFVGEQVQFLADGMKVMLQLYEGRPISIRLPPNVTLAVVEADPVMKGGTAAPSYKGARLENGMQVQVPPFINAGAKIVISTEDGSYLRRAE